MSVSILSYNGTSTTEEMNQQLFWDAASGKSYTKEQAISLGMFSQYQKDGKTYGIFRRDDEEDEDEDEIVGLSEAEDEPIDLSFQNLRVNEEATSFIEETSKCVY